MDIHLTKHVLSRVHETMRGVCRDDDDLPGRGLDALIADGEPRLPFLHDERLIIRVLVEFRSRSRSIARDEERDARPVFVLRRTSRRSRHREDQRFRSRIRFGLWSLGVFHEPRPGRLRVREQKSFRGTTVLEETLSADDEHSSVEPVEAKRCDRRDACHHLAVSFGIHGDDLPGAPVREPQTTPMPLPSIDLIRLHFSSLQSSVSSIRQ